MLKLGLSRMLVKADCSEIGLDFAGWIYCLSLYLQTASVGRTLSASLGILLRLLSLKAS